MLEQADDNSLFPWNVNLHYRDLLIDLHIGLTVTMAFVSIIFLYYETIIIINNFIDLEIFSYSIIHGCKLHCFAISGINIYLFKNGPKTQN